MLPVLLDLKFVKIYTFGIFLVLAFFWGAFLLWRILRLSSYREEDAFDGLFLSLAGGLFVSRLVYVMLNFQKFGFNILKFILINGYPGLSLLGFLLGSFLTLYIYANSKKIKFHDLANYFISPIFLALGLGKLGSFFAGLEIGSKTRFPIAIKYFGAEGFRHLTPLYESILFLIGAYISYRLLFETRKQKYELNFNFVFFCWYFSLIYFLSDFLKDKKALLLGLSFNGVVSGLLLLTFSFYLMYYFRSQIFSGFSTKVKNLNFTYGSKTTKKQNRSSSKKA